MVFALDVVLVVADELVFVGEFEEDCEEAEELLDDFGVAFAAEGLDFGYVCCEDGGLAAVVSAVEFRDVVHLHVVFDAVSEAGLVSFYLELEGEGGDVHAMSGGTVPVVFASLEIVRVVVLEFLLEWERVEFAAKGKLPVDFFLADVEVLDIEEA
jgi:hypothetical protein